MRIFTSSVAILALAATGAIAQGNGKGNGNQGNGNGGPPAAAQAGPAMKGNSGNGNGKADRGGPPVQTERGSGNGAKANSGNQGNGNARNDVRGNGQGDAIEREVRQVERDLRGNNGNANRNSASGRSNAGNTGQFAERTVDRYIQPAGRYGGSFGYTPTILDGCPPGLAKKNNGCQPPGLAKQRAPYGSFYQPSLFGLTGYDPGDYFYDDGYLLRRSGSNIAGYIPLLGGALAIGNQWPSSYGSDSLPDYYVDYYNLGGPQNYRYADDVIYRVDPTTSAIQSIAALLTGDQWTVGQPMPRGYDVYNVPYTYRDRYYDTPEANYRYSDGYVYRVDPQTQMVAAAIDLLT